MIHFSKKYIETSGVVFEVVQFILVSLTFRIFLQAFYLKPLSYFNSSLFFTFQNNRHFQTISAIKN